MDGGYGAITWWGFSPMTTILKEKCEDAPRNVLLVGAADIRNVLNLATTNSHNSQKLNIYIVENSLEVMARHILMLVLCCEDQNQIGLQEKCEYLMEIFGNSLIRSQTDDYIRETANKLIKFVTSLKGTNYPYIDVSALKFKERDALEDIFKFWKNGYLDNFNVKTCWEERLRKRLSTRYDSRANIYDWDYNMKLKEKASIVSFKEYKEWREHGIAFQMRDLTAYDVPNKTLASKIPVKVNGEKVNQLGYWGDMIVSPYISFGIECDDTELLKKSNGKHEKCATDVTCYNITKLLNGLNNGIKENTTKELSDDDYQLNISQGNNSFHNTCISFLPLNCFEEISKKSKYKQYFDAIYFSNSMVHHLANSFKHILKESSSVLVESTKFMLDLRPEMHEEYVKKITLMATANNLKASAGNSTDQEAVLEFEYENGNQ